MARKKVPKATKTTTKSLSDIDRPKPKVEQYVPKDKVSQIHSDEHLDEVWCGKEKIITHRTKYLGQILELYLRGRTPNQIAVALDLTKQRVESILNTFKADYIATLSSKSLLPRHNGTRELTDKVNEEFYSKLSKIDEVLTEEEMLYCAFFVSTGNSVEAIKRSGLDIGLDKGTDEVYDKNCLLRSEMLKRKKNVQEEIRRLRMEREEFQDVTKDKLITMHMEFIEQLREEGNPSNKASIVKLMDQLAKMTGSYTVNVQNRTISADDVLDGMKAIMDAGPPEELRELYEEFEN